MELNGEAFRDAFGMLLQLDRLVFAAALRSLWISLCAVCWAAVIGLPLGIVLATVPFFGRGLCVLVFRAAMALPTVLVGILCYILFSRRGPIGSLDLLYTPWAIVCGEFLLALPLVVSLSHGAIRGLDPRVAETAISLGAGPVRRWQTYLSEARVGVMLALLAAFSRCVTELGIAMMVGGNIKGRTRTLSTATALETSQGELGRGLAMGLLLLAVALGVTVFVVYLSREEASEER